MIELINIDIGHKKCLFTIDSIQLNKGAVYSLIGANGAGKTTFLQTIQGNLPTLKGNVILHQTDIQLIDRKTKAKTISFVNSKFDGVDYLRVKDYVGLGRIPYTNALGRLSYTDIQIINSALKELKIEHLSDFFTTQLSDGERQLTAIARAITQETDIIILDEPTAFLDYANRKLVMNEMKKIATELNKCIIISSHDLDLCLESETDILVINRQHKKLAHYAAGVLTKNELVEIGF